MPLKRVGTGPRNWAINRPRTTTLLQTTGNRVATGYEVAAVQDLMAHTDPDMTRSYQKGHARKLLRVDMMLPWSVENDDSPGVREAYTCCEARTGSEAAL